MNDILEDVQEGEEVIKYFIIINELTLAVGLARNITENDNYFLEVTKDIFTSIQERIINGEVFTAKTTFKELFDSCENIFDLLESSNGLTVTDAPKSQGDIRYESLVQENADLLLDSAIKDSKIEALQSDIADIIKEMAKGGQV